MPEAPPLDRQTMAKRDDISVKVDREAVRIARRAAALQDKTLVEYISSVLMDAATRDYQAEIRKAIGKSDKPPSNPTPGGAADAL